ncbi:MULTISPECIES: winged helix-turn-helix domain-containing protein [unclassified Coleofasciculus]|uniref:winged helix-turn-helix domain-containing protein n=1 Tax=unclassified Coleofasciculus TaxID=2692782 RepID=UPI00188191EB|nr:MULTISPECIES: winged helix-turn-helix domain-containing protein [unclassified Coleofasciculus]MBE9127311.1 response regulator transcription factor [Coleofasciculus sp. LEGE 07081]MBE9150800.1 response regulator transcription factor [Coleofasciculus sp. LEGE 07092]
MSYDKILVNTESCIVTYEGITVALLPKEYKLLLLFLDYPKRVLNYDFIIDKICDDDKIPTPNNIRTHIKGLRKAFKKIKNSEDIIQTVHGLGYRLKPLEENRAINSNVSPSVSVIQCLFRGRAIEYAAINDKLFIEYVSPGLSNYCDYPELLKLGVNVKDPFPEFIGLEEILKDILNHGQDYFEIKGIARCNIALLSLSPEQTLKALHQ